MLGFKAITIAPIAGSACLATAHRITKTRRNQPMCNPRNKLYHPRTVAQWQRDYDEQLRQDREAVERYVRLSRRQSAMHVNRPAWAITLIGLALAGVCYLAKAVGLVK